MQSLVRVRSGGPSPDGSRTSATRSSWAVAAPTTPRPSYGRRTTGSSWKTFHDAAAWGELVLNATGGAVGLQVLAMAGADNLEGKVLVDISNPMDPASGFPPTLVVADTDSMGERIQRAYPGARVVKSLNTMNCDVMVRPELVPGDHVVFVAGEDGEAKAMVTALLGEFGWPAERVLDLGGIEAAQGHRDVPPALDTGCTARSGATTTSTSRSTRAEPVRPGPASETESQRRMSR